MSKHFRPFIAFLILGIVTLACDLPIPVPVPPPSSGTATPPFSPEQVGTAVALTLTAAVPECRPTASSGLRNARWIHLTPSHLLLSWRR
jgi:hypothetical protein